MAYQMFPSASPSHDTTPPTPLTPGVLNYSEETVQLPTCINMGRGGYDTTDPGNPKSAMAAEVLKHESDKKKVQETVNANAAAEEYEKWLKQNKKSRGIRDAQRAMRDTAGT